MVKRVGVVAGVALVAVLSAAAGRMSRAWPWPAAEPATQPPAAEDADWQTVKNWLDRSGGAGDSRLRIAVVHPGTIVASGPGVGPRLPHDMTITITRQGVLPARIVVEQSGRRWEVSEAELNQLPGDVRGYVALALGNGPHGSRGRDARLSPSPVAEAQLRELEDRLQQLNARIRELRGLVTPGPASAPDDPSPSGPR